jgi:hypothetical protein
MRYCFSILIFLCLTHSALAGSAKVVQFKIKDHSQEADSLRLFLNNVHNFCILDSVALVYFKDNHSDQTIVVSEGENRMFYLLNGTTGYYVKYTANFKEVQFILDNSETRIDASVVLVDHIQFDCGGSVSNCKASDMLCIESKRKGGCVQR